MVQIAISEFMFGYAFLYEQTQRNWGELTSAPVLPSLYAEASLGWDARLPLTGVDYYYQFKVSELLYRSNASLIRNGTFSGAYYRFGLHPRDAYRQHRRLKDLSSTAPFTYYVTQQIADVAIFNQCFLDQQVTLRSRLIPLTDCDVIDGEPPHYIAFEEASPDFVQCSEPKHHQGSWVGSEIASLYASSSVHWQEINRDFAQELLEKRILDATRVAEIEPIRFVAEADDAVSDLLHQGTQGAETRDLLERAGRISALFFGANLAIIGARRQ